MGLVPWFVLSASLLVVVRPGAARRVGHVQNMAIEKDLDRQSMVRAGQNPNATQRSTASDAQFLIQSTFGPTRESLAELAGLSYEDWVVRQMSLPAELHRSYYRAHVNPRQPTPTQVGLARSRCAAGSRWHSFAVELTDRNARLLAQNGRLWVNGALRSDLDPNFRGNGWEKPAPCSNSPPTAWRNSRGQFTRNCTSSPLRDWECTSDALTSEQACMHACFDLALPMDDSDCSGGWGNFTFDGFVCDVVEAVGGLLRLSSQPDCRGTSVVMRNPAVWLARPPTATARTFRGLRSGVLLLAEGASQDCDLGDVVQVQRCSSGDCRVGQFVRHSPRLELLENSPSAPLARSASAATLCPTVRRNVLNAASCRMQPACSPMPTQRVRITLTPANLRRFFTGAGRYVYQVTGLSASSPPCRVLSRWALVNCSTSTCAATALTATQTQSIQAALQGQAGDYRDITATCDGVPAGAVVQVGTNFFRHVHLNEGSVYDFSEWVRRHPGGSRPIMRFAEQGEVVLRYPSWHEIDRWMSSTTQAALSFVGMMGATVDFIDLPTSLQLPAVADAFQASAPSTYHEVCGSPGEVANDPAEGHWFSFFSRQMNVDNRDISRQDRTYEVPNPHNWLDGLGSKVNVWFQKALNAKDQLRQRVAWALSQLLVFGDDGNRDYNEMKLAFYDIFVRHAFGNFRDILREVTYSPAMGQYLTYLNNRAFHVQGTYPDENYAREIMQLFTIGLWKLHPNGTRQQGPTGEALPTYDNQHIQNFARVFTGFTLESPRGNIEHAWGDNNWVDPMRMQPQSHDLFPKMDLDNNYLGDGYPLCSDLTPDAFLRQGAQYEFLGYQPPAREPSMNIFNVSSTSALYRALCLPQGAGCSFQAVVQLDQSLRCQGEECSLDLPRFFQVGTGYFEYVQPPCVNLFFFNGRQLRRGGSADLVQDCANPDATEGGTACCGGQGVQFPTMCWAGGRRVRFATAQARCASLNMSVCGAPAPANQVARCGFDYLNQWTVGTCRVSIAVDANGLVSPQLDAASRTARFPVRWSAAGHPAASAETCTAAGCRMSGPECLCETTVETAAVFDRIPTVTELATLRVGAFRPAARCTVCNGTVRVYSSGNGIDAQTIFEAAGRFYRNIQSTVRVGTQHSFRNPPAFMVRAAPTSRDAINEVEALLDYLVQHPNTPIFTSYRLIQRFGNSNPSARYLEAVVQAFRTGTYGGRTYSGRYGDMAATIVAILLHPEARASSAQAGALREPVLKLVHFLRSMEYSDRFDRQIIMRGDLGAIGQTPLLAPSVFNYYRFNFQPTSFAVNDRLRNLVAPESELADSPKVISFINGMVSMVDNAGLSDCAEGFGVPTAGTSLSQLTSKTRLCRQSNLRFVDRNNATGEAVLNDLSLLLTGGRLSQQSLSVARSAYQADLAGPYYNSFLDNYVPGTPRFRNLSEAVAAALSSSAAGGVTQERDGMFTLRTGTDPRPSSTAEVSWVKKVSAAARIQAAQTAILLTPEFNTAGGAGASQPLPPRQSTTPAPAQQVKPYKAVVQVYLAGGADTFQLVVPQNCKLYDEYVAVRKSIAYTPSQLLQVSTPNQACSSFGIHNKLPFLAELYRAGEAAFMSNVGNLAEPLLNRREFERSSKKRCIGVFSHEDQTQAAQTLFCQTRGAAHMGAGGRLADALSAGASRFRTASFSLAGNQIWSDGYTVKKSALSADGGVQRVRKLDGVRTVIGNITDRSYDSVYSEIYVRGLADTVRESEEIGKVLDAVQLKTQFPRNTHLQRQLHQVARLIASRVERKAERDFFFVSIGGFDTHSNVNQALDRIFTEIDGALQAFVNELKAQNIWSSTVLFTASDFARTLTPNDSGNDAGTDHAWAGNHLLLGGGIQGSRVYNDFPASLLEGSPMDLGRGRLIPQYPYESFMVPMAQWLGVEDGQLASTFPNLDNFNRSVHIIPSQRLFRP